MRTIAVGLVGLAAAAAEAQSPPTPAQIAALRAGKGFLSTAYKKGGLPADPSVR